MSTRTLKASTLSAAAVLLAGAVSLAGCGGGTSSSAPRTSERAGVSIPAPLFDERGRPLAAPPGAVPADTAARTRPGLYATRAQYEWEALMSGPTTILLDVDVLGSTAMTVLHAQQVRGFRDGQSLTYFVQARRPADAAEVVNALADEGFAPVFVIVR